MQAARLMVCVANDNNNVHTLYRPRQQVTATVPLKSFYGLCDGCSLRIKGYRICQCHEIFYPGFFRKQLLLVPLDTSRKGFDFFQIFEELLVFVIDSSVYSPPGSRDSLVYSSPGSRDFPVYSSPESWDSLVIHPRGVGLNWLTKEPCWCKIH
jgi:hypothetical protein